MAVGETTLGSIKEQARQRCDRVNSTFFTEPELNYYATQSYKELYDILVQKFDGQYFVDSPYEITADGTNELYALPADFYKAVGVDIALNVNDTTSWFTLKPFMMSERNRYVLKNVPNQLGRVSIRYKFQKNNIWFTPLPTAGQKFRIFYAPRPVELTDDADIIDGISGWEEYIITDLCIKMMTKEESDPTVFIGQKQALLARIESAAENRDAGSPQRVSDVQTGMDIYGGFYFGGFEGL